jgi:hyaluronan synthase
VEVRLLDQVPSPSDPSLEAPALPRRWKRRRRPVARHASSLKVEYQRPSGEPREGTGVLREWSRNGGRFETRHPLYIGEWIHLRLAEGAREELPAGGWRARVVWENTESSPPGRHTYGVEFARGARLGFAYALYCTIPLLAVVLFVAGVSHVFVLKAANIEYFWYRPLANTYSLIISFYILSRFALSAFYRPPKDVGYRPSVTVVVACKNEEDSIGRTIDCVYASDYPRSLLEVVAVNDGSTDGTLEEMRAAQRRHPGLRIIDFGRNLGKRHGMAAGARAARGEVLVYVDSDSFVRCDTIAQLVQGFANPNVGAVCGHAYVQNARKNFLTRMQEVRYYVAFRVVKAAESLFGAVACCSGCLAAYRRSYVMEILDAWLDQTFLGTSATFGDDRSLTNFMLRRYRVIYSATASCSTLVPETYRQFFRQQLRWKKSWVRETFIAARFMWQRHPLAAFFFYLGGIFPMVSPLVVFNALVWPWLGYGQAASLLYIYGATLMSFLYGIYYLGRIRTSLWVYGVAFSFFYMFVLVWQTYYAMFTVRRNHWGTR